MILTTASFTFLLMLCSLTCKDKEEIPRTAITERKEKFHYNTEHVNAKDLLLYFTRLALSRCP